MRDINIDDLRNQAVLEKSVKVNKFITFRTHHFQIRIELSGDAHPRTVYGTVQSEIDSAITTNPYLTTDELYHIITKLYPLRQTTITTINDIYNVETTFTPIREK